MLMMRPQDGIIVLRFRILDMRRLADIYLLFDEKGRFSLLFTNVRTDRLTIGGSDFLILPV